MDRTDVVPEVLWKPHPTAKNRSGAGSPTSPRWSPTGPGWTAPTTRPCGSTRRRPRRFWSAVADHFEVRWHDRAHAVLPTRCRVRMVPRRDPELRRARAAPGRAGGRAMTPRSSPSPRTAPSNADPGATTAWSAPPRRVFAGSASAPVTGGRPGAQLGARPRRVPGHGRARGGLVVLLAGFRCAFGDRPVHPDRANGADRGRRLPVRRPDFPVADTVQKMREALPSLAGAVHIPALGTAAPDGMIGWDEYRPRPSRNSPPCRSPRRCGCCTRREPPAAEADRASVGGILLEHLKSLRLHWDLGPRRPVPVVHHHRLDDVELPDRRAAGGRHGRAVRRQPRTPRPDDAVADRRAAPGDAVRDVRAFVAACEKAGLTPATELDLTALGAIGSTGSPLATSGFDWLREQVGGRHPDRLVLRRHRCLHRDRRRRADCPGVDRGDLLPRTRRQGRVVLARR